MPNSGHHGLLEHGHFRRGFLGGILRHHKHGDNPNDSSHLMSRQLILNTQKNASSGRLVATRNKRVQIIFRFFF